MVPVVVEHVLLLEEVVGGMSLLEDEGGSVSVVVATVCLLNHLPTSSGSSASFING